MPTADEVPRWERGRLILASAVRDRELTRALKLDLEILGGVRPDDPAREIIMGHARDVSDELPSLRMLRDELRAAHQREQEDLARFDVRELDS